MINKINTYLVHSRYFRSCKFFISKSFNCIEACQKKLPIKEPQHILLIAQHDIANHYKNYNYVKEIFEIALRQDAYMLKRQYPKNDSSHLKIFQQTLSAMANYPLLQIQKQSIKVFYKMLSENMHLKTNQYLQQCLLFSLMIDKTALTSPIFIQFVKYYIKDSIQLLKSQLSINLNQQNVINTIKLFAFRIYQKGFFSRKPLYYRNLYIVRRIIILQALLNNDSTHASLMIKKIHFEFFQQVKQFYQYQMKQNLYHAKNIELFDKLTAIIHILSKNPPLIQNQNKYLRQLYLKLFLIIQQPSLLNVIYLYVKINTYIKQTSIIEQKQSVLLKEFMLKVQILFSLISNDKCWIFENQQIIEILLNKDQLNLNQQKTYNLVAILFQRFSSLIFKKHLIKIIKLLNILSYQEYVLKAFESQKTYQSLSLQEIKNFCQDKVCFKHDKIKQSVLDSILSRDIKNIDSKCLLNLLKIYICTKPTHEQQNQNQQLLKFILRFISDHHKKLCYDQQFQQLIQIIFDPTKYLFFKDNQEFFVTFDFNDTQGNYQFNIVGQLKLFLAGFLSKISNFKLKNKIQYICQL